LVTGLDQTRGRCRDPGRQPLLANGRVLIAGGFDQNYEELASAVVYRRRSSRR
jgi:hypothetical protein